VPLHFMNQEIAVGVKTGGGVVSHTMNEIEVQCLADDLPEYIEVDLKDVQLNEIIHVNDLKMPPGVEPVQRLKSENPTVASVHVPKVAAVEEEAAAPVTEITGQTPAEAAAAAAEADKGDKGDKDAKK
jgi:large subunit ribosomal protein L25